MTEFIDRNRIRYGVESICSMLPIAPSTYYAYEARRRDPERMPARSKRDAKLRIEVGRVWRENRQVYGARKVWKQMNREGHSVAPLYGGTVDARYGPFRGRFGAGSSRRR